VSANTLDNINPLLAEDSMKAHGVTYVSVHVSAMTFPDMPSAHLKVTFATAITDHTFPFGQPHDNARDEHQDNNSDLDELGAACHEVWNGKYEGKHPLTDCTP